jgi:hypothetical protein
MDGQAYEYPCKSLHCHCSASTCPILIFPFTGSWEEGFSEEISTSLCDVCKTNIFKSEMAWKNRSVHVNGVHHATFDSLMSSVEEDCYLCSRVFRAMTPDQLHLLPRVVLDRKHLWPTLFRWMVNISEDRSTTVAIYIPAYYLDQVHISAEDGPAVLASLHLVESTCENPLPTHTIPVV